MNAGLLKAKWTQLKGEASLAWPALSDEELEAVDGQAEKLVGLVQSHYGYDRDRARTEVDGFLERHRDGVP
jgi:uncharacterized protein YjbJ (UPF0337 family)